MHAVHGLPIAVASVAAEHGLRAHGLRAHGLGRRGRKGLAALQHAGSSGTRIKPLSPALAGGFFTTEPPGTPQDQLCI